MAKTEQEKQQEADAIHHRQIHCSHAFIQGAADKQKICVHCGIPYREYAQLLAATTPGVWGGQIP